MSRAPADPPWPDLDSRRAGFERMYRSQPDRFGGPPSRFCEWALPLLAEFAPTGHLLELGCGRGRDARRLAQAGYRVRATDYARPAIDRARADPDNPPTLEFEAIDAASALRSEPTGALDVVYAHALYMMLSVREFETVVGEIHRVLRPGGLHLYAVRSVTDPMASEGEEVAPEVRRRTDGTGGPPATAPYRYFRRESIDRLTAQGFERVRSEFRPDLHFWFVADRRP